MIAHSPVSTRLLLASCLPWLALACGSSPGPSFNDAAAPEGGDSRGSDDGGAGGRRDATTSDGRSSDSAESEGQVACGNGFCPANQVCCSGCAGAPDFCAISTCPDAPCQVTIDASSSDALTADAASTDAVSSDAGACGATSCLAAEICVHPGCGGGVAICDPPDDAGACSAGWTRQPLCFRAGGPPGPGCVPPPCTPPLPYCFPRPASCPAGGVNCACLPLNVCNGRDGGGILGGLCSFTSGSNVTCGFE